VPFQVTCNNNGRASLENFLRTYQILNISYQSNSFMVTNDQLSYCTCDTKLHINGSSEIDLASFTISAANQKVVFLYNSTALRLSAYVDVH
jgi:hypothetical protein